jgi:dipeptide/tripeptide permease
MKSEVVSSIKMALACFLAGVSYLVMILAAHPA